MFYKNYKIAIYFLVTIFLTFGLTVSLQSILAAWSNPTQTPVNGNPPGPVFSQSTVAQLITGGGGLGVQGPLAGTSGFFSGNVGIGANPQAGNRLYIYENNPGTNGVSIGIENGDTGGGRWGIGVADEQPPSGMGGSFYIADANAVGNHRLVIDRNGNVGIGTWTPSAKLEIRGATGDRGIIINTVSPPGSAPAGIVFGNSNSSETYQMYTDYSNDFRIHRTSSPSGNDFTIDNSGYVGLGRLNPTTRLDVSGAIHASGDICTDAGGGKCLSTAGAGGVGFGTYQSRSFNNNYTAATDGFVTAYISAGAPNDCTLIQGLVGGAVVQAAVTYHWGGMDPPQTGSISFPVPRGAVYRVSYGANGYSGCSTTNASGAVFWTPAQ